MARSISEELAEKTYKELGLKIVKGKLVKDPTFRPQQPIQSSRVWKHPQGYKYLTPWSNGVLLRFLIRKFTESLPRSEYRSKTQTDDAGRSMVRNIEEGWKRPQTSAYIEFIGFSQGSLEEIKGDVRDWAQDGFLPSKPGSSLSSVGIDLKSFNESLKSPLKDSKGNLKEFKGFQNLEVLYPPLASLRPEDLTYEIFLELINKTDYLLRVLVQSLEKKLEADQKGYQIDRLKLKGKVKGY